MTNFYAMVRSAAVAVAVCLAGAAAAKDMRYPETGPVAFVLHIPDSWNAKPDNSGNLLVIAPDRSSALSLSVTKEDAESTVQTRDQFANAALAAAKAQPFSKQEPSSIGGSKAGWRIPAT